jgi:hypothetical protein
VFLQPISNYFYTWMQENNAICYIYAYICYIYMYQRHKFFFWVLEKSSCYVPPAILRVIVQPRLVLNSWSTCHCLGLPNAGITYHHAHLKVILFFSFLLFEALEFELMASHLLGRCPTAWDISPAFLALFILKIGSWFLPTPT